ncbi:MAG: hypothetical protein KKB37_08520 [Alphaproteobacteria bacterium]|nr:hypothetical protein [Alphaproteobacteria bacterium]
MTKQTLASALQIYGREALLLTVGIDGPHTCNVTVELADRTVGCIPSKTATRNMRRQPNVSLVWPAIENGGYAIIANGVTEIDEDPAGFSKARITLTKSVLHRAGPRPPDGKEGPCSSDCVELV